MRYRGSVTLPANTAESAAIEETLDLCHGRIRGVSVLFPPGCAGLAHLQILYQTRQIFPSSQGQSFIGDGPPIVFGEDWPIHEEPYSVVLRGWNLDETYEHTVYVAITMLAETSLVPLLPLAIALPEGFP